MEAHSQELKEDYAQLVARLERTEQALSISHRTIENYRAALMRIEQLNIEANREAVNIACITLYLA